MTGRKRTGALALVFIAAACTGEALAPRPSGAPAAPKTATAPPASASHDTLYIRTNPGTAAKAQIVAVSASTGATLAHVNDGAVTADGRLAYWTEPAAGATKTLLHVSEVASGREVKTFTIDGDLHPAGDPETFAPTTYDGRLTPEGRFLALSSSPYQLNGAWIARLALVDTESGTLLTSVQLPVERTYGFLAISPEARSLFVEQYGGGATRTRVLDVATATLTDLSGPGPVTEGFRTAAIRSPDGTRMYRVDSGHATTNCTSSDGATCVPNGTAPSVVMIDLVTRRSTQVRLPMTQLSGDFEKYMLWSLAMSEDGTTLYAANPALGIVDEIDARTMTLHRAASIPVSRTDDGGIVSALVRVFLPVADAKRYLIGGAVLSPDGRTLFAAAHDGIAVVDTERLDSRAVWQTTHQFDALRASPDGAFVYGLDNRKGALVIVDAATGADVGEVRLPYMAGIVRIDPAR